jgi:galactose mutarotase-like enzyme
MELSITQEDAGHSVEGLPLYIFTLCNRHGMEVRLSTLGGAITSLRAPDRQGRLADIVHGDVPDCGIHLLPAPGHALHRLPWHAVPLVEDTSVGLRLVSPGAHAVVASYVLDEANCLSLHCHAAVGTPATLSLRAAFNLAGEGKVGGQLLTVRAERVIPAGAHEQEVAGTAWDCRSAQPVGVLPGQARYLLDPGRGENAALRLLDPGNGRLLEIITDASSVRLGAGEPATQLWLEPLMAASNGLIMLRCGVAA